MLTCYITENGLTGQNNGSLVAPSKVTMEFEISRIFQCLTLLAVLGFSEVRTKQDIILAIKWRSTCRVIHINLVAFIKRFLEVLFDMFEEGECFKEVGENFKKEKIWGFDDSIYNMLYNMLQNVIQI